MMRFWCAFLVMCAFVTGAIADNSLTEDEKKDGWVLLFNGKNLDGWKEDKWNPGGFTVEQDAIKAHGPPGSIYLLSSRPDSSR